MDYTQRMVDFTAKCGLPPPETATGAVVIDFNGIAVSFLDNASDEAIVLHAGIGEALGGSGGEVARDMLEANATLRGRTGAVLAQDPETKAFAAIRSIPIQIAEPDFMVEAVSDLVKTAASWKERLDHQ